MVPNAPFAVSSAILRHVRHPTVNTIWLAPKVGLSERLLGEAKFERILRWTTGGRGPLRIASAVCGNRAPVPTADAASRSNPLGAIRHFSKLPKIAWFLLAIGLFQIAHAVFPSTWNFHGEIRYGWSKLEIGLSLAFVGLGSALSQALLTGYLIKRLGPMRAALFGLGVNVTAMVLFALADAPWMAYAIIAVSALGGVTMPAINTITSTLTPKNAQGELQGAQASIMAFTLIFSPLLMTQTLSAYSVPDAPIYFPGAAFLLAAGFTLLAVLPFLIGVRANQGAIAKLDAVPEGAQK